MNVQEATTRRLPDLKERHLPENCRETINTILKETYGYEQFRNLEIYDDLSKGKEKLCISQGQLIENVILEAEKAWKGETQVDNILLTAPTGSGKSLLFQLPAIYLGKEYNLLTIVVSPLKALIVDPGGKSARAGVYACGIRLVRFIAGTEDGGLPAGA